MNSAARRNGARQFDDPFLRWILGIALGLALLHAAIALIWDPAQVVVLPWFVPTMESFSILAAAAIAFLCLGRSRVLREPSVFWIGLAFWANALLTFIYVLTWPGLVNGMAILTASVSTFAWVWHEKWTALALLLGLAPLLHWPDLSRRSHVAALALAVGGVAALLGLLTVAYGDSLPPLVADNRWTLFNFYWTQALALAFVVGAALSLRRYLREKDAVLGYVALVQIVSFLAMEDALGDIWGFWWYFHRILQIGALSVILFGLLSEYVLLYRRERERTQELEMLQQEAQKERNRLRVLIDTVPVGIAFHSAPDGRLELFNRAAEAIAGRPMLPEAGLAEQAAFYGIHLPTGEPFPPGELPASRSLRGETCTGVEMLIRQPSGRQVYLLANCAPLRDVRGRITGAVVAFLDITLLKEQERLRDEFIATAAHELKTPVTTIKGYAQLMRQWAPEGHEPREGKAIEVINVQCDRINRRVQEMLEAVRFRTSPPELHRVRFDLGDLASQVVERMQASTQIHRLVLHWEGPAPVEADRERIEEVLVSLVDNALKYSQKGGEIEVRVGVREGNAIVSVKDHGVGIPRERQPHIFEPFYEAIPPGAPGYRGVVALSLYLSKLTVERHKGRIWFESEEGRGSTFYFSLPMAERAGNDR